MTKIRLLVVDDHPVVREGVRTLLNRQPDMEVVGQAGNCSAAMASALELKPDVVLLDITMGDESGLAVIRELRKRLPRSKVLVLTVHEEEAYLRRALELGATGYVLKQAADAELAVAIRAVARGDVFVYPSLSRVLLRDMHRTDEEEDSYESMSPREKEVLRLVALGYTNQEIANKLFLSIKTVETYRARVVDKLDLKSRSALVRYALDHHLLEG